MDVYIIAGPNGVGKTTFARKFLPTYANCRNFVNADLISERMSPCLAGSCCHSGGRLVLSEIRPFPKSCSGTKAEISICRARIEY
jgi:predicted ABC-type ATPase